jgi:hypothetical protein
LRLSEINRKSAELSAVSSKLADMASQLNRLRKIEWQDRIPQWSQHIPADETTTAILSRRWLWNS